MNKIEVMHGKNSQLLWLVLGLRVALFLVELLVGLWSHSLSLLAGAGHVFSDLLALGLTLLAAYASRASAKRPENFQERQLEICVALMNGSILMAIAFLITWETISHLPAIESELSLPVLLVAGLGVAINGVNIYLLHKDNHADLNLRGIFLHGVADAASSFGVMLSALVIYYWQWLWADAVASFFVVALLIYGAISLWRDSFRVLKKYTPRSTDATIRLTGRNI